MNKVNIIYNKIISECKLNKKVIKEDINKYTIFFPSQEQDQDWDQEYDEDFTSRVTMGIILPKELINCFRDTSNIEKIDNDYFFMLYDKEVTVDDLIAAKYGEFEGVNFYDDATDQIFNAIKEEDKETAKQIIVKDIELEDDEANESDDLRDLINTMVNYNSRFLLKNDY